MSLKWIKLDGFNPFLQPVSAVVKGRTIIFLEAGVGGWEILKKRGLKSENKLFANVKV